MREKDKRRCCLVLNHNLVIKIILLVPINVKSLSVCLTSNSSQNFRLIAPKFSGDDEDILNHFTTKKCFVKVAPWWEKKEFKISIQKKAWMIVVDGKE